MGTCDSALWAWRSQRPAEFVTYLEIWEPTPRFSRLFRFKHGASGLVSLHENLLQGFHAVLVYWRLLYDDSVTQGHNQPYVDGLVVVDHSAVPMRLVTRRRPAAEAA